MYQVYILLSLKDKRTYVGYTRNIEKRFLEHSKGRVSATRHRRPLEVFYLENIASAKEAKQREKWWKSGAGRMKLKEIYKQKITSKE